MLTDYRIYEMLAPEMRCRPGDEPEPEAFILIEHKETTIKVPIPKDAKISLTEMPEGGFAFLRKNVLGHWSEK